MNPSLVLFVAAMVSGLGEMAKRLIGFRKTPRLYPLFLLALGMGLGILLDPSSTGFVDGMAGALAAMGLYSGAKHANTPEDEGPENAEKGES